MPTGEPRWYDQLVEEPQIWSEDPSLEDWQRNVLERHDEALIRGAHQIESASTMWGRFVGANDPYRDVIMICPASEICNRSSCNHRMTHMHGHISRGGSLCTDDPCERFWTDVVVNRTNIMCIPYKVYVHVKHMFTTRSFSFCQRKMTIDPFKAFYENNHAPTYQRVVTDFELMFNGEEEYLRWLKQN